MWYKFLMNLLFMWMSCVLFASSNAAPAAKTRWDYWYTEKNGSGHAVSYYNEQVKDLGKEVVVQVNLWRKQDGFIQEEHFGGQTDQLLTFEPKYFMFEKKQRNQSIRINGTTQTNGQLRFVLQENDAPAGAFEKTISKGVFLASFFPVWIGEALKTLKVGELRSFQCILEDQWQDRFPVVSGMVRLVANDAFADKTKTKKVTIHFMETQSTWYVDSNGAAVRMESPRQLIERTDKITAQKSIK